ncbi:hypothetical protein TWF506_004502 [Arthrobotrys conoides]|uniref:Uncharacterized protein n=1 Tax=Arthrobotrys conoides TaxID=74498 RepID=A0AAN8RPE1_9PEZI
MAGPSGTQRGGTQDEVCTLGAVKVCTPPSFSPVLTFSDPPKPKIPYSILYRLPIVLSEASFNALFQHSPSDKSKEVSSAKPHPSLALLRVIIFRLSNNLFEIKDISRLLDSVDRLGYRDALKQLLALKTVSTEAACYNLIDILYERSDGELILHIRATYPDFEYNLYRTAWNTMEKLSECRDGPHFLGYGVGEMQQCDRFHLFFGALIRDGSKVLSSQSALGSNALEFQLSKSLRLILNHIERYGARPASVEYARLLLLLCEEFLEDLGLFFELWDPIKIPAGEIESLRPYELYMPLATTGVFGLEALSRQGFQHGKKLLLLRASIEKDYQLFQACVETFYPTWGSEGPIYLLSFNNDSSGDFLDFRTQEVLWEIAGDISCWRCFHSIDGDYESTRDCSELYATDDEENDSTVKAEARVWVAYYDLLIYIAIIRQDLMHEILEHLWKRRQNLWLPPPDDSAQEYTKGNFEESLLRTIKKVSIGKRTIFREKDQQQTVLSFKYPLSFLGGLSFSQTLGLVRKIISCAGEDGRGQMMEYLAKQLFSPEPDLEDDIDQDQLRSLIQVLQENGFHLDRVLPHDNVCQPDQMGFIGDLGAVEAKGEQRPVYVSFRKSSPWLFSTLLSCGAALYNLQDSFQLESNNEVRINEVFLLAAQNQDYEAISRLWGSRIILLKPETNSVEPFINNIINTIMQGESDTATDIAFLYAHLASPDGPPKFVYCLRGALESKLDSQPGSLTTNDLAIANFCKSVLLAPVASLSAVGDWYSDSNHNLICNKRVTDCIKLVISDGLKNILYSGCVEGVMVKAISEDRVGLVQEFLKDSRVIQVLKEKNFFQSFRVYIIHACRSSLGSLKLLLAASSVSVEDLYRLGIEPLHNAIYSSQFNTIIYLLSEGANIYAREKISPSLREEYVLNSKTAVETAVYNAQIDTVALFLEVHPGCAEHALSAAIKYRKPHVEKHVRNWMAERDEMGFTVTAVNPSDQVPEALAQLGFTNDVLKQIDST